MSLNEPMMCANCGKGEEGAIDLKFCTACKMVKYCNRDCQIAHRPQHKRACKKRAAELHDELLFKEPPPCEECPICMLPLPLDNNYRYYACCGKSICDGCIYAMHKATMKKGKKWKENVCAFCRTPPRPDEEFIRQLRQLLEKGNASACYELARCYANGKNGLPQDRVKAKELYLKAGEFGCAAAYCNLGYAYHAGDGVEIDKKKSIQFYQLAAMKGDVFARYNLGATELKAGDFHRAYKHFMISARAGYTKSLDLVKHGFMNGHVTKDQYANTLREYQKSQDEMKSDTRDKAVVFLR